MNFNKVHSILCFLLVVLDEMIYAFDCKANKDDVYMRFDIDDQDGVKAEQKRISNGFRLFGKYYESLWD